MKLKLIALASAAALLAFTSRVAGAQTFGPQTGAAVNQATAITASNTTANVDLYTAPANGYGTKLTAITCAAQSISGGTFLVKLSIKHSGTYFFLTNNFQGNLQDGLTEPMANLLAVQAPALPGTALAPFYTLPVDELGNTNILPLAAGDTIAIAMGTTLPSGTLTCRVLGWQY